MLTTLRIIALLVPLALLLACGAESGKLPSQIDGLSASATQGLEGDAAPRFSDWSAPVNLGPPANTTSGDFGSFISKDGLSLYISCDASCPGTTGGFDIRVSQRASVDAPWGPPQKLGPAINTAFDENAPTITNDGHRMLFTSNRPGFGGNDIWMSRRRDKRDDFGWEPPLNLGSVINTAANDAGGVLFEDDETGTVSLYFTSNRPGTAGAGDIYVSRLMPDGTFSSPVHVAELNSPSSDQQPAIRRDGLEFFLASDRPGTVGVVDLWVATRPRTSDPWGAPVNLGSVVNSASTDARPALSFKGTELYFQSNRPGGFGAFDLYVVTRSKLKGPD